MTRIRILCFHTRIPNPQLRNDADPCQCFFSDLAPQLNNDAEPYPQLHNDADPCQCFFSDLAPQLHNDAVPDPLIRTDADPDPLYCVYLC